MASSISTNQLKTNVRQFITSDPTEQGLDTIIESALIDADRDLRVVDSLSPLAWDIEPFDGYRTKPSAEISAITQADPGVITAESTDSDVDGHGFDDHSDNIVTDIVRISGVGDMEELNGRLFLLQYVDEDTFTLKTIDNLDAVDTTNYTEYDSGGVVYHAGYMLNTAYILAGVSSKWTIKELMPHPKMDGVPLFPATESEIERSQLYEADFNQRPSRYRYWQHMTASGTVSHYVFWFPVVAYAHNFALKYVKEIPDLTFGDSVYPFHPPQVHSAIWHGALAKLVGESRRMHRNNEKVIATQLEVLFAQKWQQEWAKDKIKTIELSRRMLGDLGDMSGITA